MSQAIKAIKVRGKPFVYKKFSQNEENKGLLIPIEEE
jgi:hypothetical protein